LERYKLQQLMLAADARESKVPMSLMIMDRLVRVFGISMPVIRPASEVIGGAAMLLVMVMKFGVEQMKVGSRISVMMMEERGDSGALCAGIKKDFTPPSGRNENGLPTPASNYPPHRYCGDAKVSLTRCLAEVRAPRYGPELVP